jgi:ATP-dependent Clp protease ATP-binding subunit ClpA
MFERFTRPARVVVMGARAEAERLGSPTIGTQHLLLGLVDTGAAGNVLDAAGVTRETVLAGIERLGAMPDAALGADDAQALKSIGIDLDKVLGALRTSFPTGVSAASDPDGGIVRPPRLLGRRRGTDRRGTDRRGWTGGPTFAPRSKKVLELAVREAVRLGDKHIGTAHLLLGVLREGQGLAARILVDSGQSIEDLRARVEAIRDAA